LIDVIDTENQRWVSKVLDKVGYLAKAKKDRKKKCEENLQNQKMSGKFGQIVRSED
jgi:hypothetical protein